jgi:hypothetical protein
MTIRAITRIIIISGMPIPNIVEFSFVRQLELQALKTEIDRLAIKICFLLLPFIFAVLLCPKIRQIKTVFLPPG